MGARTAQAGSASRAHDDDPLVGFFPIRASARVRTAWAGDRDPNRSQIALVRLLAHAWCSEGAVVYALRMWRYALQPRRAQGLVLDRFAIDASVALAYWFGHRRGVDLRIEQALLRVLSPRPRVSVLLLADAETLHSRRADEYTVEGFHLLRGLYARAGNLLGAVLVDADRPVDEVARDVATAFRARLP